ncbi:hypothetical protein BCF11_3280 [Collimonas sp. PA-H2]|uniref:hypothetical protein n=1 Tax=Collimonas sp. PA-H2 TaxID=1881062 RepID=UPI000BFAAE8F|nr:hypothetical protein [Collimonas sp. PA-H2]PFH10846.1 hypothetical protein BCF11_3280 [Collimonas sp. PA-H2]
MSTETSFLNVESITISPVQTSLCFGAIDSKFLSQRIVIHFIGGGEHALTFFCPAGQAALTLDDLLKSKQVTA